MNLAAVLLHIPYHGITLPFSDVVAQGSEQLLSTSAEISCTVSGLTRPIDSVKWLKPSGDPVVSGLDGFNVKDGTFVNGSQTTVLRASSEKTTDDKIYTCLVTVNEHGKVDYPTSVSLSVFRKFFISKFAYYFDISIEC